MCSRIFLFALMFAVVSLAVPAAAHASIPFFGPVIPQPGISGVPFSDVCPAGWGMLIMVINNIISLLITLGLVLVAPIMIAYSGYLYVVSPVDPAGKSKAKGILLNTIIGIIVMFAGWLIVDAVMAVLYNPAAVGSTWSNLIMSGGYPLCLPQKGALPTDTLNQVNITSVNTSGSGTSRVGAKCAIQNSGACDASGMSRFGVAANQASVICYAESSGNPNNQGDQIISGPSSGSYVSFGLFQINITANDVNGLGCPTAFDSKYTGSHKNVQIVNQALYNSCKQAALDPTTNIQTAYSVFQKSGYSWKPWSVSSACGLAFLDGIPALSYVCNNFRI